MANVISLELFYTNKLLDQLSMTWSIYFQQNFIWRVEGQADRACE